MKFWDASAIVPLLVAEASTQHLLAVARRDPEILVWWGTEVECGSALARLEREGLLEPAPAFEAWSRLAQLADSWAQVEPSDIVRENAIRLLRVHALRAADALQLAAAFVAADRRPRNLEVVTLDDRLAGAMRKEGYFLVDAGAA